jgi:hypothetical protein
MPSTFVLVASRSIETPTTTVTFNSIPQTYTDLRLIWSARGPDNTSYTRISYNGINSMPGRVMYSETSGNTKNSFTQTNQQPITGQNYPTNITDAFANNELYLLDYTNSSAFKAGLHNGVTGSYNNSGLLSWCNYLHNTTTAAINSITFTSSGAGNTGAYLIGSTFQVYGIKNS